MSDVGNGSIAQDFISLPLTKSGPCVSPRGTNVDIQVPHSTVKSEDKLLSSLPDSVLHQMRSVVKSIDHFKKNFRIMRILLNKLRVISFFMSTN